MRSTFIPRVEFGATVVELVVETVTAVTVVVVVVVVTVVVNVVVTVVVVPLVDLVNEETVGVEIVINAIMSVKPC